MSYHDTEDWGGPRGKDSSNITMAKCSVVKAGSCNACNGQYDSKGYLVDADAWVWVIGLQSLSFRLCSKCMKVFQNQIFLLKA